MDDPLSPHNINPSWSDTPTASSSFSTPHLTSDTLDPLPTSTSGFTSSVPSSTSTFSPSQSEFDREPKVFGAPVPSLFSPTSTPSNGNGNGESVSSAGAARGGSRDNAPYLRVRISGLERNRKDLLIRFDASTNLPNFRTSVYRNMQRSYIEFQRFGEQAQLCCPQTIIPALPLPSTSALTDEEDDRLVRIALQRWFTRICEDPILMKDDELRSFIESDFGYTPVPPPSARRSSAASAATGVFSAALSKVVRREPLDEDDELQSAKNALDKLEERWGTAATAVNGIGKARRAFAVTNADVGAKLVSLSTVESDPHLAAAERKMGRTWEHVSGMLGAQAASENVILSDSLGYQALNARAARDALVQRTTLLEDSQTATKSAINKRRNVERMKGSSKIDPVKVDDALHEMGEANALETSLSNRLQAISQNLHLSIRTHSRHAHEDIAVALLEAARMSVMYHKQHLRELEALKPDLAKIGTSAPVSATPKVVGRSPKRNSVGLPPIQAQTTPQAQVRRAPPQQNSGPPPLAGMPQGFAPVPTPTAAPATRPPAPVPPQHSQTPYNQGPQLQPQPQQQRHQSNQPPFNHQQRSQPQQQQPPYPHQQPYTNQNQPAYSQQGPGPSQGQPYPQQPSFSGYPQQGGYAARPPPGSAPGPGTDSQGYNHMNGTQSMFLPNPNARNGPASASASGFGPGPGPGPSDPLGGGSRGGFQGAGPGAAGVSQSVMLPPHHRAGTPNSQNSGTMGRGGGRKLDERQAARMLAGGF
ncbi:uncharacterized protein I303_100098 [Kwoniella dejecticola CBS 10117]|uniref:PX domain-containing protein n=1 Tax=Kwoniella dejecticola CBS 10117 TaxID=1296121 RepID=A0A1A6ADZ0_9TREE|nr:uncharacterized protein I303_00098 [Kwoniella dejecticola CBS 10117]OBR88287.1 hypothetical protein I303_00098 [Kwoniella dejecticola CBS 10117]